MIPLKNTECFVPAFYLFANDRINIFDIPEGIEIILDEAFAFSTINYISIPTTVISIKNNVFANSPLELIEYKGIISQWHQIQIGEGAFDNTKIKKIVCTDGTINLD